MCTNKHYYCMFNGITVTTSDIIDEEYKEYICVRFERPNNNNGFDFAEIIMPDKSLSRLLALVRTSFIGLKASQRIIFYLCGKWQRRVSKLPKILAGFLGYVFYFGLMKTWSQYMFMLLKVLKHLMPPSFGLPVMEQN